MKTDDFVPEWLRRGAASVFQWGGWLTAFGIYGYDILRYGGSSMQGDRPAWMGLTFIASLCVGICGTLVRSRMRLSDTIILAFRAGMEYRDVKEETKEK